jgi:heavy metal translocating P-type ATPase
MVGGRVEDITVEEIVVGDRLLVRPGELVPCDAEVAEGRSHVDTSPLTGEPMPRAVEKGTMLLSGSINGESPLVLRAVRAASESQYARIVQLVRSAQESKSPVQRLADRYAVWFTPITLVVCAIAYLASGDATRVLAVLVVATPCPLILATPVAVIGGINRAARRLIVVRNGTALEQMGEVDTIVFDKTGTVTLGIPRVSDVRPLGDLDEARLLRLAGAVELGSGHLLARSLVTHAEERGVVLPRATAVREAAGQGVVGTVDGHVVHVGALGWLVRETPVSTVDFGTATPSSSAELRAYVAVDGRAAGVVAYADAVRDGAAALMADLRSLGVRRLLLLSGDDPGNVEAVAAELGITEARGALLPQDKVVAVRALVEGGARVAMVGDGTNDAPALAAATVGIAMAGHGGGITAEAADVVLLVDDPQRVAELIRVSRRTLRIARESIWVGLGLSGGAMLLAAAGLIPPVAGALIQEGIDVAVILNALRASGGSRVGRFRPSPAAPELSTPPGQVDHMVA